MRRSILLTLALLTLGSVVLSACAGPAQGAAATGEATSGTTAVSIPAMPALPDEVQAAPQRVREAYQFAVAHPDALKNVPCYCGCGAMGHTSNLSCYVKDRGADGKITFETHALGCSLCVDIAQDVMRMTGEHKSPQDIRASIVAAYSKYGPGNQP
jgi:predicted small secreted protein